VVFAERAPPHEAAARPTRDYHSLGDLGGLAGRTTRRGAVATRQPLDPIRLPFAELLHVVELRFFQEVDGSTAVSQHVEGRDVVALAFEESAMVTAMTAQSRGQGRFRAAHIHKLATRRGNAVEASKEGLRGGRIVEVHGRRRSGKQRGHRGHRPEAITRSFY
jgi:hypothetical protein